MAPSLDSVQHIGVGMKDLLETLETIYGERAMKKLTIGANVVKMERGGKTVDVVVTDVPTLGAVSRFVYPRLPRRQRFAFDVMLGRIARAKPRDAAMWSDAVAGLLAHFVRERHHRRKRPVMRYSSVGGSFDRLHGSWTVEACASMFDVIAEQMMSIMAMAEAEKRGGKRGLN